MDPKKLGVTPVECMRFPFTKLCWWVGAGWSRREESWWEVLEELTAEHFGVSGLEIRELPVDVGKVLLHEAFLIEAIQR